MNNPLGKLTATSPIASSASLLVLRLVAGGFMAFGHGLGKLQEGAEGFPDPLGIGSTMSHFGAVTSEFFCALLVAVGLFTRIACIPLIFTMAVAALIFHGNDPFFMPGGAAKEPALIYLTMFAAILIAGPGRFSADAAVFGRRAR